MANKGGRTTAKRQIAPVFWDINRKQGRFILKDPSRNTFKKICIFSRSYFTRYIKGYHKYA